jgi:hypothetical protein
MGGYFNRSWIEREEGVDWIHLAQDRGLWRVLVKKAVNFRLPYKEGNYYIGWATVNSAA